MKRILVISMIFMLSACATPYQQRTVAQGAVIGATAGAVIGHQSGNATEGAMIGGALGALAGAVIAEQREQGVRTSAPRYHRRACTGGAGYFERAHRANNLERKINLLRKGLRYCPNNPAAHNDLGVALVLWGDDVAARNHFNRALQLDPGYYPARRNLDRLNSRSGYRHRVSDRYDDDEHDDRGYKDKDGYGRGYKDRDRYRGYEKDD